MKSYNVGTAEAKRLVLIVGEIFSVRLYRDRNSLAELSGDGLRADLLFAKNGFPKEFENAPGIIAPNLRSIVEKRGAFGVSHTRVPTESRPGHVAIIGLIFLSLLDFGLTTAQPGCMKMYPL